jgi:hypothetical protein
MSELAKALRAAGNMLLAEAAKLEGPIQTVPGQVTGTGQNVYAGAKPIWEGHVPAEFLVGAGNMGTRPDTGGPGWQVDLRRYAAADGKEDRNAYVKSSKLVPIWPDVKQNWEP